MSAFADAEIIRMCRTEFVPVTGDDWYTRRRNDSEGTFFRKMSDQTDRRGAGKDGTRQGIYVFTADGEALSFKNAGNSAEITRAELKRALARFARLPANRRLPGAVAVEPPGKPDPAYARAIPEGGAAVRVQARILDRAGPLEFDPGVCGTPGGSRSARDMLWITANEIKAMLPANPAVGQVVPLPATLATRLCRHHLVDNTRGETPPWAARQVRRAEFALTVSEVTDASVTLRLAGEVLLADDADPAKAERGYDAKLGGSVRFDRAAGRLVEFEVTALGNHWGQDGHTETARPGRGLLGIAFGPVVQAGSAAPADRVPPQGARDLADYLGR